MSRLIGLLLACIVLAGCGRGYESDNRAVVDTLPVIEGVALTEEDHYGYCSADTCLLGNDRSGALMQYTVDTDQWTQQALAEKYGAELDDWESEIGEACLSADEAICDEVVVASFTRGDAEINLNFDNWPVGRFEIHVDARGAE